MYEIPDDALRVPWVSGTFIKYIAAQRMPARRDILPASVAAAAALVAHALMIAGAIRPGGEVRRTAPFDARGPGSIELVSDREPVMTLILIQDPGPREKAPLIQADLASRGIGSAKTLAQILSPDAAPAYKFDDPNATETSTALNNQSPGQRAELFGRYTGQINARIDRAWIKPRTPIEGDTFRCRILIKQNHTGEVLSTTLQDCNGDLRWQISLVQAIERASPLPAPPDPGVFADALTLNFTAKAYAPGSSEEGYEPVSYMIPAPSTTVTHKSSSNGDVLDIQITGSPSHPSGQEQWGPTTAAAPAQPPPASLTQ